ncbi:MAG: hypothetical protein WC720_05350 [Candidatus Shapirobacteria bacterium]|jgi:hypothetical protein
MKVQITHGMEGGKNFMSIYVDGEHSSAYGQSRKITGTHSETGDGIFTKSDRCEFVYGEQRKTFVFNPVDINTPKKEYIKEIQARIKAVKAWIASCDYEESFSFEA